MKRTMKAAETTKTFFMTRPEGDLGDTAALAAAKHEIAIANCVRAHYWLNDCQMQVAALPHVGRTGKIRNPLRCPLSFLFVFTSSQVLTRAGELSAKHGQTRAPASMGSSEVGEEPCFTQCIRHFSTTGYVTSFLPIHSEVEQCPLTLLDAVALQALCPFSDRRRNCSEFKDVSLRQQ